MVQRSRASLSPRLTIIRLPGNHNRTREAPIPGPGPGASSGLEVVDVPYFVLNSKSSPSSYTSMVRIL